MITCEFFFNALVKQGVQFFTGVPDSSLKDFCAYVTDHTPRGKHIIAANEGGAIALACGYHLATALTAVVYMQNSGQGNAVNPLVSLADSEVYSIPVLLLVGWRGEPGKKDEPQHVKQGKITLSLFDTLNIPYEVLPETEEDANVCIKNIFGMLRNRNAPVALIVKKETFEPYELKQGKTHIFEVTREEAVKLVVDRLPLSSIVVSTTGKTSRELYEYRDELDGDHSRDFLTVGSMGHSSQIALGIACARPSCQVICFDGDGAAIMHMGSFAIIGSLKPKNFKHIIFNNGAHDSVGGQPTVGFDISFTGVARACGYNKALQAETREQVEQAVDQLMQIKGPALLEIKVKKGARRDLGRPKTSPKENKTKFMKFVAE